MSAGILLTVLVGSFIGGMVSGLSGFAFGLVALSFWTWVLDPRLLAPMVVFGSLLAQLTALGAVRREFNWRSAAPFLIGGVLGVPLGVLGLGVVNVTLFRGTVGAILVVYSSMLLFVAGAPRPITAGGRLADGCVGLLGGAMGGLAGLTGPAPTLWCNLRGWDKATQRSVFFTFNLAMQTMTMAAYAAGGQLNVTAGKMFLLISPAVVLAAWIGGRLFTRISEAGFRRTVLILLFFSGVTLLLSLAHRV